MEPACIVAIAPIVRSGNYQPASKFHPKPHATCCSARTLSVLVTRCSRTFPVKRIVGQNKRQENSVMVDDPIPLRKEYKPPPDADDLSGLWLDTALGDGLTDTRLHSVPVGKPKNFFRVVADPAY